MNFGKNGVDEYEVDEKLSVLKKLRHLHVTRTFLAREQL